MKKLKLFLLDLLFPNRCPFCDDFIPWDKLACDRCIDKLETTGDELCNTCGKSPCQCGISEIAYDRCYAACYYEGTARKGIISLKSDMGVNSAELFADIIYRKIQAFGIAYDLIVPVPMAKKKKVSRGYNQAEIFAKALGERLNVPVCSSALIKVQSEIEQHTLSSAERAENVKRQFSSNPKISLKNKNIILCDDVMTTGSTINYCTNLLKEMGAKSVTVAVCTVTKRSN